MLNKRFNRWLVLSELPERKNNYIFYKCLCDCSNIRIVNGCSLRSGKSASCGCYMREVNSSIHKNKITSKETKKRMSESMKGENNPAWKGGITPKRKKDYNSLKHKQWRTAIYERDNYTCQRCGDNKSGNLRAHHIESYNSSPELRTTILNGITFCKDCHLDFHHQYGYGNNTIEQFNKFMR